MDFRSLYLIVSKSLVSASLMQDIIYKAGGFDQGHNSCYMRTSHRSSRENIEMHFLNCWRTRLQENSIQEP